MLRYATGRIDVTTEEEEREKVLAIG
jgi:hypothetical protein